ncbi:YciI family protein [Stenotrophomonas indicatrix]|uniref:YciI family protein n=1 Tax=Stenotrophomonas indicatrix TaxID=2045451 RepID=UPI000C1A4152|nr:YciI family protein [Stenotrophomonas indicatrix]MBO1747754.1 YciI family protein [Stenotrophomonas indicatrix]PII14383.1 dehydrogenase [Stenotrophomonas indicatrix]
MKVMVIVKANADSEAGRMPSEQELAAMGAYNEQLVAAGIMLAGEGLHATQRGRRVHFGGGTPRVESGPFGPAGEQIAGFWLWEVRSLDEATEWASRAPFGAGGALELRPLISAEDFGEAFTPELQQQEQRLREQLDRA